MSDIEVQIPDCTKKVREYAALGYTPSQVVSLLNLSQRATNVLTMRIDIPGDEYYEAYRSGRLSSELDIDRALAEQAKDGDIDSIKQREERGHLAKMTEMKKKLFGV